jgi:hypothetical protein
MGLAKPRKGLLPNKDEVIGHLWISSTSQYPQMDTVHVSFPISKLKKTRNMCGLPALFCFACLWILHMSSRIDLWDGSAENRKPLTYRESQHIFPPSMGWFHHWQVWIPVLDGQFPQFIRFIPQFWLDWASPLLEGAIEILHGSHRYS